MQNISLNDDIGRPANHQQVLDIVAPDQNEPPTAFEGGRIDDRKARLAAAVTCRPPSTRA